MSEASLQGRPLVAGEGLGQAIVTVEPLSFWGGVDPQTGIVIDKRHPLAGQSIAGKVLVLPFGRGSCSASGVLLESIRNGTAPKGIVVSHIDPIIGLGSILGEELLGETVPVVLVTEEQRAKINSGDYVHVHKSGLLELFADPPIV